MLEFVLGYSAGSKTASRAASLARSAAVGDATIHSNRIEDLNERIDMMAMLMRGMWALLEEQGFTAEQLMAKLEELDQADGTPDGRIRALRSAARRVIRWSRPAWPSASTAARL